MEVLEIPIVVAADIDAPTVPDQILYFTPNPTLGALDVVGNVQAADPDPDQWLSYRIVGENDDFSIDSGTGRLIAANDEVLPLGETSIEVEAFYELSPAHAGQGTVTIHRVPAGNHGPYAGNDYYSLLEDQQISGNIVLGDALGGQADWDVNGDDISLVSVSDLHGNPIPFDVPYELPSGAQFVVHADGSFTFDAAASEQLNAGYYGSTYEDILYTIADEHAATSSGAQASFVIDHVNDLHGLLPQMLSLNPTASAGDPVGQIFVSNAEPDELLSFTIVSANPGNVFAIDSSSGLITLNTSPPLTPGQSFTLMVEVEDAEAIGLTTAVTINVADNQAPVVPSPQYITAVDLPLTGHVLDDLTGSGPAFDPDGDALTVAAVDGQAFHVGRAVRLPSGANLTLNADGSFVYDPSTSLTLPRLAADDQRTERIEFTTRDARGATAVSHLAIEVGGRNWAPQAFDNVYTLGERERLTGNVIQDFGVFHRRDRDQNTDELTLVSVDGQPVASPLTFTSRRGAWVSVFVDGRFEYDPAGVDFSGLLPGERIYDAFSYHVADEFQRTALAMARIEIEKSNAAPHPFWISAVGLVNDTNPSGGSDHDDRSEDPRIQGDIAGTLGTADHFLIELDLSAMAAGYLQTPGELNVDASIPLPVSDPSFPHFEFDPSSYGTFGTYGEKALAFRAKAFDQQSQLLGVSSWDYFQFEWLQMLSSGPIRLEAMQLFHDTASIDDDGQPTGHDDLTTTDPRLYARVGGDFNFPPLTENDSREVRLDFEHTRDAMVYTDSITIGSAQSVLYDPRSVDPGLSDDFAGALAIAYTVNVIEVIHGTTTENQVAAGVQEFYYYSVPASCGVVTISEVPAGAGGYRGPIREVIGTATWGCAPNGGQAFVEFDYADAMGNFDGLPDGDVGVVIDHSSAPAEAPFEFTAIGLPGTQPRIRARTRQWSTEHGAFQMGDWSSALQLSDLTPPGIASVSVDYQQPQGRELPVVSGYLVGSIDDNNSGVPYDLGAVGFVGLDFYHRDINTFVFSDTWPVDGTSITDALGRFEYRPEGLTYDADYRIWARTRVTMPDGSTAYGVPEFLGQNVVLRAPVLPEVEQFQLFDPNAAQFAAGRWQTSDTRVAGSALQYDNMGIAVEDVQVEFAHDYVNVTGDEEVVAGIAVVESDGSFHYAPLLAPGNVDLRARIAFFDYLSGTFLRTDWYYAALPLAVEARTNEPAVVEDFQLVHPISGSTGVVHTGTPTVSAHVVDPDGYVAHVIVEFRDAVTLAILGSGETDGSGSLVHTFAGLAPGSYTVDARAYEWDYLTRQEVPGPWTSGGSSLSFVLDAPLTHEVASLVLLSDTGPVAGVTANPTLFGMISGEGPFDHLAVAIDHGDNGSVDATIHPDGSGSFVYAPDPLPYGPHTYRAKLATWRSDLNAFEYSAGAVATFTLEYQPNNPAQFAAVGLEHPAASVSDPTIVGRITNERQLEDVTVELDFDTSDANGVNQMTTTDELGQFRIRPWLTQAGPTSIRARTRELDAASAQYLTSAWYAIPTFDYQPVDNLPATLTLDLLHSSGGMPPVTTDPTVFGYVQNDGPLTDVRVEFAWSENGPIVGTALVDSFGYYEFEPGGLTDGQLVTLWARARESLGPTGSEFLYGPSESVAFVFSSANATDLYVSDFGLLHDTATSGGSTASDGSTQISILAGSVAWSSGSIGGLTVELDVDHDFQRDSSVLTNGSGEFQFDPAPAEAGFYSVRARVQYPTGGVSDWKVANFVFDTNDSSPQALTLVHALSLLDSDWQSATDLEFATISELADALFGLGEVNAESEYDFAITVAEVVKSGIEQSVERDYEQAHRDAEASYRQEIAVAQQAFLTALNALPVDQRPTYTLQDFVWPARPFSNDVVIPEDAGLPQPPAAPSYDGPTFDPFQDPVYRAAVWQAEQSYLMAAREAEQLYLAQRETPYAEYRDDIAAAQQDYDDAIRQATDDYDAARANRPELDDTDYMALADALSEVWRSYSDDWQSAYDAWQSKYDHALQRRDQALSNAWDDAYVECENDPPTIAGYNTCADRGHAASEAFNARSRRINAEFDRSVATAAKERNTAIADALHAGQVAAIELERQMAGMVRQHQHDTLVDLLEDVHDYNVDQATASDNLASRLAQAHQRRDKALADLVFDKDQQIAEARRQREQSIATALLAAVQHWSISVGTPWAAYRADVTQIESEYRQEVIGFEYERDHALAGAVRFEAHTIAAARAIRSDQVADAEALRATSLGELLRDYRIQVDLQYLQRDAQLATDGATYRTTMAAAGHVRAVDTADNMESYLIKVADANEANHQPGDITHVRCLPGSTCNYPYSGFEYFVYQDNSAVRERNSRTHRRQVAEAERDRELEQANIDEAIDAERIDATKRYRQDAHGVTLDTTVAQANLRFAYQVDVATAQDDYNIAVATAVADYTVDLVVAEAGRTYREIAAAQNLDASTVVEKRVQDNLSASRTREFQISQANAYVTDVASWSTVYAGPWSTYQTNLAHAELNRVTAIQLAEVNQSARSAQINVARIQSDVQAELDYAQDVYGEQGAYVERALTVAAAYTDMAEENALADFVSAQADAQTLHDIGVAHATLAYRTVVTQAEAVRDEEVGRAFRQRRHGVARAIYAATVDPESSQASELSNAAYEDYIRHTATANLELIVSREETRLGWKLALGELNVRQVRDIVASQLDRAEQLREDAMILTRAVADAVVHFSGIEAGAAARRNEALVLAEASEAVYSAESAAIRSHQLAHAEAQLQHDQAAARSGYEVGLHYTHKLATLAYSNSAGTSTAAYYADLAAIRYVRAVAEANATANYFQALADQQVSYQDFISTVQTNYVRQTSAANVAHSRQQTTADDALAVGVAQAFGTLHVQTEAAKAELNLEHAQAQAADIDYAEAARDRDDSIARADYQLAMTIGPAQADLTISCATNWWSWGEYCQEEQETYDEIQQHATERFEEIKRQAQESFQRQIRAIELREDEDRGAARMEYVTRGRRRQGRLRRT